MLKGRLKTAFDLMDIWYRAKSGAEAREITEKFKTFKFRRRRNQIFFKTKGLVAHDRHLTYYPRSCNEE